MPKPKLDLPKSPLGYSLEQHAPNVHTLRFDDVRAGWETWIMLSSDRHHDNIHCQRDLELDDLELAKSRKAIILDVGDLFCAMQGKYDPRRNQDDLRPEDKGSNYLDLIVQHATDFYAPYSQQFALITPGNHESAVLNSTGTDLTDRLVHRLNSDHKGMVAKGGYGGWVRFLFTIGKTQVQAFRMKYYHGSGGGGAVTRGVIQTNRQAVYLPDADIVVNGHTHDQYHVPIARERMSAQGAIHRDIVHFIRTGTYKDEYGLGSGGWAVEKGHAPKPLGCSWLHFYEKQNGKQMEMRLDVIVSAK